MNALVRLLGRLLALVLFWRRVGRPRPEEVEPDPEKVEVPSSPRAENAVIVLVLLAALAAFGFVACFVVIPHNYQALGASHGLALLFGGVAAATAGKAVVPQETKVEERSELSREEEQEEVDEMIHEGGCGLTRRRALRGVCGLAGVGITAAVVAPVASFGPRVGEIIDDTGWHRGRYVVDEDNKRVNADDLDVGNFMTAFPEHIDHEKLGSAIVLARLRSRDMRMPPDRRTWTPYDIVAYSKICTHAGCAVEMFRYPLSPSTTPNRTALVCPCHYSTFDAGNGASVLFGPAGRPLPQLPLMVDADRYLVAAGSYSGPPGPAWLSVRATPGPSGKPQ